MGILDSLFGGGDQPQQQPGVQAPQLPQLGFKDRMQAIYSPGLYGARQQAYQTGLQQQQQQSVYEALVPRVGPEQARVLALNPHLLEEMAKPQNVPPGGQLMSGISGMLGGGGQGGAMPGQAGAGAPPAPGGAQAPNPLQNRQGMLDDPTLDMRAEQRLLGDDSVEKNAGMGAIGQINRAEISKRVTKLAADRGISPEELVGRTARFPAYRQGIENLTKIQSNMGTAGIEFQQLYPKFEEAVRQYGGSTKFPTLRAFEQYARLHTGDPGVVQISSYLNTLANVYARATSTRAGGPTVSDKEHFRQVLDKNWNPAQVGSAGIALNNEIRAAHDLVPLMAGRLKVQFNLADKAPADMIAQAQDAIRRGAPREKVQEAIEQKGFRAEGL